MGKKFDVQVSSDHYYREGYDDLERFINYFYQINLVRRLRPESILEVGVGNKTVVNYLKQNGFNIDTGDFDKNLEPDFIVDIRDLPFEDNSYNLILACEILEHLPWNDLDKALKELYRVTEKYVIISVPYSAASFEFIFRNPFVDRIINKIFKTPFIDLFFRIPHFYRDLKFLGQHYWVLGRKNYSIGKFRKLLKTRFKVIKEIRPILDSHHHFFLLEKRQ